MHDRKIGNRVLTRRGQVLYHILRMVNVDEDGAPVELDLFEFLDEYICNGPSGPVTNCLYCGRIRRLIGGAFCMGCTRGATRE